MIMEIINKKNNIWLLLAKVLHRSLSHVTLFINVIKESFLTLDKFCPYNRTFTGLVILSRNCNYFTFLAKRIQKSLLAVDFFFSDSNSHVNSPFCFLYNSDDSSDILTYTVKIYKVYDGDCKMELIKNGGITCSH